VRLHPLVVWLAMWLATAMAIALPAVAAAQSPCLEARDVRFSPSPPRAGTLFRVHLPPALAASVTTARLAGEPLHFRTVGDTVSAFAAVPVDSTNGLTLALLCINGARVDVRVPTRDGEYPLERLTVAPRFSAPPDSALLARQRREAARAAEVSRASHETPRLFTDPFLPPRATRITSGFGGGRTFNGTVTSRHMGTDYAGAVGAPVRATNRGVVRIVDAFYLGGNVVYLDHGEGLVSAYLHLSRQRVAVGDTVARGQVIGEVGATGRVTGPHLHLIVRYGNVTVDPESVIERR
jgi:murein DD-endopeptidase MepM/ murein hydrolase activator NlpD